jgi:hypothetical protein
MMQFQSTFGDFSPQVDSAVVFPFHGMVEWNDPGPIINTQTASWIWKKHCQYKLVNRIFFWSWKKQIIVRPIQSGPVGQNILPSSERRADSGIWRRWQSKLIRRECVKLIQSELRLLLPIPQSVETEVLLLRFVRYTLRKTIWLRHSHFDSEITFLSAGKRIW